MGLASLGCSCCHVEATCVWQDLAGCVVMWKLHECGKSWLVVLSCGSYMCVARLGWLCCHVEATCVWQVLAGCVVMWKLNVCGKSWLFVSVVMWQLYGYGKIWLFVLSCGSYRDKVYGSCKSWLVVL